MYLQITTRCNFKCAHCMFSCTNRGVDMTLDTVRHAVRLCADLEAELFIGGGEPTLHPQFWEILGLCLKAGSGYARSTGGPATGIVTNGSQTEDAIALARLAETGVVYASLSRDEYHQRYPIDDRVIQAFTVEGQRRDNDNRELRSGRIFNVVPLGRARRNFGGRITKDSIGCGCGDCHISPDGTIYQCSCQKVRVGDVINGFDEGIDPYGEWGCSSAGVPAPRREEN